MFRAILGAFALLAGGVAPAVAMAQEKTPAAAFAFISSMVTDGTWTGGVLYCDEDGNCSDSDAPVISVTAVAGNICHLQFSMRDSDGETFTRRVDLAHRRYLVWAYRRDLNFEGPVITTKGEIIPRWKLTHLAFYDEKRLEAALDYLGESCQPKSPF